MTDIPNPESWRLIGDGWADSLFTGSLPSTLYRYRRLSNEWVEDRMRFELFDEGIFLSGIDALNDPDEGRMNWIAKGTFNAALAYTLSVLQRQNPGARPNELMQAARINAKRLVSSSRIPKNTVDHLQGVLQKFLRIACFTTQPLNGPMWAHYGNSIDIRGRTIPHAGICIEYTVDDEWRKLGLRPVEYKESRPEINLLSRSNLKAQFAYATRVKSPHWAYEDEWRLVAYFETMPPETPNSTINSRLRLQGAVRSVIFGLNAKGPLMDKVTSFICTQLPHISIQKVVRAESDAALMLSNDLTA